MSKSVLFYHRLPWLSHDPRNREEEARIEAIAKKYGGRRTGRSHHTALIVLPTFESARAYINEIEENPGHIVWSESNSIDYEAWIDSQPPTEKELQSSQRENAERIYECGGCHQRRPIAFGSCFKRQGVFYYDKVVCRECDDAAYKASGLSDADSRYYPMIEV